MTNPTMRERLIERTWAIVGNEVELPWNRAIEIVDAILIELQGADSDVHVRDVAREADPGCGCPCCLTRPDFTAMIDAVREGK